ncbi:MAG: 4Fe-4S ferredoxin [Methanobacteriales archaeon HGW-Methanobacteriales-1]|nr:MAG: 4Fe-4S ferredoxin [Methanobacteriales archaeon HGW-Methanobacteriales-1]
MSLKKNKNTIKDIRFKKSGFKKCIQCGRCTASCPAAYLFPDYKPRDLMRRFMFNEIESPEMEELIWKCGQCYSCRIRCPRNCKAGLGVLALQSDSVLKGNAPSEVLLFAQKIKENLYNKGETILPETMGVYILKELGDSYYKKFSKNILKREKLGFLKDDTHQISLSNDSLKEIRAIMELTGMGAKYG